jgi:ribose transport system substrate-binding protein
MVFHRAAWALAAWAGLTLSGCGGSSEKNAGPGPPPKAGGPDARAGTGRIVLVTNGNSDWWSAVEKGMRDSAEKFEANVEMKRNDGSVGGQIRLLEEALSSSDVQGVAVSVLEPDASGIVRAMRKLKDSGKKIITIDSDIAPASAEVRSAYIGTNNTRAGESAGKAAAALRPRGGTVAAFVGTASAANARERLEGFYAGAGPRFVKPPVEIFEDQTDMNKARSYAQIAITKYPDVGVMLGLYSYNAPRIADEVSKAPEFRKKTTIVTFDLDEQAVDHLDRGNIDASICQNPYEIGYRAVRLLQAMARDDKATVDEMLPKGETTIDTGVRVIVPTAESAVKGDDVITIKAMKEWLASKGLKSS